MGKCEMCGKSGWLHQTVECRICGKEGCAPLISSPLTGRYELSFGKICYHCIMDPNNSVEGIRRGLITQSMGVCALVIWHSDRIRDRKKLEMLLAKVLEKKNEFNNFIGDPNSVFNIDPDYYLKNYIEPALAKLKPLEDSIEREKKYLIDGKKFYNQKEYHAALDCFNKVLASDSTNQEALEYKKWADGALQLMMESKGDNISVQSVEKFVIGDEVTTEITNSVIQKSSIGIRKQERFQVCPYCGKELNLLKTPKYCPYCREQLEGD